MALDWTRRHFFLGVSAAPFATGIAGLQAQPRMTWSAAEAFAALQADTARVIDVRSREEWQETGVGLGVWPISMHEDGFPERFFAARDLAGDRDIGLICATGGRSATLLGALMRAGYGGYADVSEGMLGSRAGPGWLRAGLPVVSMSAALAELPPGLA